MSQDFSRALTLQHPLYRPDEVFQDVDPGGGDAAVPQCRGSCLTSLAMLFEVGVDLKLQVKRQHPGFVQPQEPYLDPIEQELDTSLI